MSSSYGRTWDLDAFFAGGSGSPDFAAYLQRLEDDLERVGARVRHLPEAADLSSATPLVEVLESVQDLAQRVRQAGSFARCLTAQDMHDERARLLRARVGRISGTLGNLFTSLDAQLVDVPDRVWQRLLEDDNLRPVAFPLDERRRRAVERLAPEQETLANDLAVDGYHGWNRLYDTVVARMRIPFEEEGQVRYLSAAQAANRMSSADRRERADAFTRWQRAWDEASGLCADALNHLAGFRLALYRRRGWSSVLKEPLDINRLSGATLETMWAVIDAHKHRLVDYLSRKADLLGIERPAWYDLAAPLGGGGRSLTYDQAAAFVIEQFDRHDPHLADLARRALREGWVESEDRGGKRPGGFCAPFPQARQSRIFLTFAGRPQNVRTLAHELGHAYHQHLLRDLPYFVQRYPMTLAETASTHAELVVTDGALRHAADDGERLALLDEKLQRAVAFFMNLHARFLFETRFYQERRRGPLPVQRLNELMEEAQREAFRDGLDVYLPQFWASKMHFYLTHTPFYNFPYTFGFLFSTGLFARSLEQGSGFRERYVALLRDTGRMRVEELARRHLGVDLTRPDFWQQAAARVLADVDEFERLAARAERVPEA